MATAVLPAAYPSAVIARYSVFILSGIGMFTAMDISLTSLMIEPVKTELALSDIEIGSIQGLAYGLSFGLCAIPIGLLIDRVNRTRLLSWAMVVWSVAMVVAGFAQNFTTLFACECVLGATSAALLPASVSLISDLVPPSGRSAATGIFAAGEALGMAVGYFAGGLLFDWLTQGGGEGPMWFVHLTPWRAIYILFAAIGALMIPLLYALCEPLRKEVLQTATGLRSAARELRVFRSFLVPLYIGYALEIIAVTAILAWLAPALMRLDHQTPGQFGGWLGLTLSVGGITGAALGGKLAELSRRHGRSIMLPAAVATLVLAPCTLLALTPNLFWLGAMLAVAVIATAIVGVTQAAAIAIYIPNELRGLALGIGVLAGAGLGRALAPGGVGMLTEFLGRPEGLGYAVALVGLPSALLGAALFRAARLPLRGP